LRHSHCLRIDTYKMCANFFIRLKTMGYGHRRGSNCFFDKASGKKCGKFCRPFASVILCPPNISNSLRRSF
jgi:hypothetical protein